MHCQTPTRTHACQAGRQFVLFLWWSLVKPGQGANPRPTAWVAHANHLANPTWSILLNTSCIISCLLIRDETNLWLTAVRTGAHTEMNPALYSDQSVQATMLKCFILIVTMAMTWQYVNDFNQTDWHLSSLITDLMLLLGAAVIFFMLKNILIKIEIFFPISIYASRPFFFWGGGYCLVICCDHIHILFRFVDHECCFMNVNTVKIRKYAVEKKWSCIWAYEETYERHPQSRSDSCFLNLHHQTSNRQRSRHI